MRGLAKNRGTGLVFVAVQIAGNEANRRVIIPAQVTRQAKSRRQRI